MKPKILINVSGGLIQSIIANTKDIDIVIVDYDSEDWAEEEDEDGNDTIPGSASVQLNYKPDSLYSKLYQYFENFTNPLDEAEQYVYNILKNKNI